MPKAIAKGREGAGELVSGLRGGERWRVCIIASGAEAITERAPRLEHLAPKGRDMGVEVKEVTVGEEEL